jgi:hypothetical protein
MGHTTEGAGSREDAVRTTRLRWFTGRFLTARDLTDEQAYHLDRHRLHNRLLHGWGVVCGLEVRPHDRIDCAHEWVWVEPGIAIDCRGREILVTHREAVRWPVDPDLTSDEDISAVLCLRYRECLSEPMPALVGDCSNGTGTEPGRVVEGWCLEVHAVTEGSGDVWSDLVSGDSTASGCAHCGDGCGPESECSSGCLTPACELGDCVPIALLTRCRGQSIRVDPEHDGMRPGVRRTMPTPTTYLTHAISASWVHGGDVAIDELVEGDGELRVRFDRDLAGGDQDRVGVNPYTFLVEVEDSTGARERLPFDPSRPPRVENRCEAVFTIDPDSLRGSGRRGGTPSLVGDTVFVTLVGDLIHDCHGLPVDADFFGTFPTGDGVRGGVLRSWFFVSDRKEAAT